MKLRVAFLAASLIPLPALLVGCGGGSGGKAVTVSRKTVSVTITIQWPTQTRSASRVYPAAVSNVLLEVFNGTTPVVAPVVLTRAQGQTQTSVNLPLPSEPLTFYANAYSNAPTASYATNPATGLPAAPSSNASLARGVTTVDVTSDPSQVIAFAMNNNVVSLVPNFPAASPQPTQTTAQPYQSIPLDNATGTVPGTLSLANLMSARDAQGNTLLLSDSDITWQVDPADPLGAQKATVSGLTLTLHGTGQVNLIATDTKVNPANPVNPTQQKIQGVFPLLITPAAAATTLTANVTQIPTYARSVTLTVGYDPLGATDTVPASPATVTNSFSVGTTAFTQTVAINNNGRKLRLTARVWSNTDGTGTLYGTFIADQQPVSGSPFTLPITSNTVSQPIQVQ